MENLFKEYKNFCETKEISICNAESLILFAQEKKLPKKERSLWK